MQKASQSDLRGLVILFIGLLARIIAMYCRRSLLGIHTVSPLDSSMYETLCYIIEAVTKDILTLTLGSLSKATTLSETLKLYYA